MDKIKGILNLKNINLENILCLFIILCPILDIVSFGYRNIFNKSLSPSTVIRPLIPVIVMIYLFFKKDKKFKIYSFIGGLIYFVYAVLHLLVFKTAVTGSSYSTIIHEAQYLINYSFMILNLCGSSGSGFCFPLVPFPLNNFIIALKLALSSREC